MPIFQRLAIVPGIIVLLGACGSIAIDQATSITSMPTLPPVPSTPTLEVPTPPPPTPTAIPPTATPTPTPLPGGLTFARGTIEQRPLAIMFDNHPAAYPQTGMDGAVMVFEALAEYGLTRYMGIFVPGISPDLDEIGAVRSARLYFVQWAMGLSAVFVHAGGSPDSLVLAESATEIVNMDALRRDGEPYFYRDNERDPPHNLYTTSTELQRFVAEQESAVPDVSAQGLLFKPDLPLVERPSVQRLDYYFIYADDPVGWTYDPETNGYFRLRRNKPHVDGRTNAQLWFKNIVAIEVDEAPVPGDDKGRIEQRVIGEGRARFFLDGREHTGHWRKPAAAWPLRFYHADDTEVLFNVGPVWIVALPDLRNLTVA